MTTVVGTTVAGGGLIDQAHTRRILHERLARRAILTSGRPGCVMAVTAETGQGIPLT